MADDSGPAAGRECHLTVAGGSITVCTAAGKALPVDVCCLERSKMLLDLTTTDAAAASEAVVPVSEGAFLLWMQTVCSAPGPSLLPPQQRGEGSPPPAEQLTQLLIAADVLIDEGSVETAVGELAHLQSNLRVLTQLPDHLLAAVMGRAPLQHALTRFPADVHLAALRAHLHLLDSDQSLHVRHMPPETLQPALAAATALCTLRCLSLEGSPVNVLPDPGLAAALAHMSALTSLCLRDTGMHGRATAALADVLPTLPRLHSMDLSRNPVPADSLKALCDALPRCSTLRRLDMSHLAVAAAPTRDAVAPLVGAAAVAAAGCQQLTGLSFGITEDGLNAYSGQAGLDSNTTPELLHLIHAMHGLSDLRLLELYLPVQQTTEMSQCMADMLADASHLCDLRLAMPHVAPPGVPVGTARSQDKAPSQMISRLARCLAQRTALTSLHLRFGGGGMAAERQMMRNIAQTPCLLRELRVYTSDRASPATTVAVLVCVAEVLPWMTSLTQLHACTGGRGEQAWLSPALRQLPQQLLAAAAEAPQLRELCMQAAVRPVHVTVANLCAAAEAVTHVPLLRLDLGVHEMRNAVDEWQGLSRLWPLAFALRMHARSRARPPPVRLLSATLPELAGLEVLVVTSVARVAPADMLCLLRGLTAVTGLRQLCVSVLLGPQRINGGMPNDGGEGPAEQEVATRCEALSQLPLLTRVKWVVQCSETCGGQPHMHEALLRVCSTRLRSLELAHLPDDADEALCRALPRMQLTRLVVWVGASVCVARALADSLPAMPALRAVRLYVGLVHDADSVQALMSVASQLHGVDCVVERADRM